MAIAIALFYFRRNIAPIHDNHEVAKSPQQASHTITRPRALDGSSVVRDSLPRLGASAERAVRNTLAQNPALKLSSDETKQLERIFAKYYTAFMEERNQMVTVQATGAASFEIRIPSWPDLGSKVLNTFINELEQSQFGDKRALVPIAKQMFEGYTEHAGLNAVAYEIDFTEGSDTVVKYTREVTMIDPVTRKVKGTGFTEGELDLRQADPVLMAAIEKAKKQ